MGINRLNRVQFRIVVKISTESNWDTESLYNTKQQKARENTYNLKFSEVPYHDAKIE